MGDVLIDNNGPYQKVVCETVQLCLEQAVGLAFSEKSLPTLAEVTELQKAKILKELIFD